jgi:hypothetical protein
MAEKRVSVIQERRDRPIPLLVGAILPGFARIDVRGVNPGTDEPFENCAADELGTVMQ